MSRLPRDEAGVTLIELMIATALMALIMVPIVGAMFVQLQTATATQQRTTDSAGAQVLSGVFVTDVQSSDSVYLAPTAALVSAQKACDATALLELRWQDASGNGPLTDVSYRIVTDVDGIASSLLRAEYTVSGGVCSTPSLRTVVQSVDIDTAKTYATCDQSPTVCPFDALTDASTSQTVGLHVTASEATISTRSFYGPYGFDLRAARRRTI